MLLHEGQEQQLMCPSEKARYLGIKQFIWVQINFSNWSWRTGHHYRKLGKDVCSNAPLLKENWDLRNAFYLPQYHSTSLPKYCYAFIKIKDMASPGRLNAHLQLEGTLGKKKDIQRKKRSETSQVSESYHMRKHWKYCVFFNLEKRHTKKRKKAINRWTKKD